MKNDKAVDDKIAVREAEEMYVQKTIETLPELIEQRKFDFAYQLKELIAGRNSRLGEGIKGSESIVISEVLFKSLSPYMGVAPKYNAEKMSIVFDLYREMITDINIKYKTLIPNKSHFCRFAGMSTDVYDDYLRSNDLNMVNVMKMIDDYFFDTQITSAQHKEIDGIPTMFRQKVEQKKVEAVAPVQHVITPDADMERIFEDIQRIKSGKRIITNDIIEANYTECNGTKRPEPKRTGKKN